MEIHNIGIVGCGQMGGGIAQICAQAGYQVVVSDTDDTLLKKGIASIRSTLRKNVRKGSQQDFEQEAILSKIRVTNNLNEFSDCDLVVEAITENMELKKQIFTTLNKVCSPDSILATNTSFFSIFDLAITTRRWEKVVGLHFFKPVPLMKLLEVVKTFVTSEEVINTCKEFGAKIGKQVVVVQDQPGFIVNRLIVPFILNAIRMMEASVACKDDIDKGVVVGLSHPTGPLALADLIGLDTLLFIANTLFDEIKDPQYAPPPLLAKMVKANWLGKKTGKGFYVYVKNRKS